MDSIPQRLAAVLIGAAVGYFLFFVIAGAEDWEFYTIHSLITGRPAMTPVMEQSGDLWIPSALCAMLVGVGAASAFWVAKDPSKVSP